jgi:putative membrane protein
MQLLVNLQRICLVGHVLALLFGLAGLLIVLPNPAIIAALPPAGQTLFGWSMAGGGVVYIVLGALAVALYAYQTLGWRNWLGFMVPAVFLSLGSELLGTSTGFPFGHYSYLSGLGYKIAGLVPFTIPLSWFYLGFSAFVLTRNGLEARGWKGLPSRLVAIAVGAVLLTAWDLVLDPAMSQAAYPFWEFQEVGQFFGMPYRNLTGWLGTGALFMAIASLFWRSPAQPLTRSQLTLPLVVYGVNFAFGAIITLTQLDARFWIPTVLAILFGLLPALLIGWSAPTAEADRSEQAQVEPVTVSIPSDLVTPTGITK